MEFKNKLAILLTVIFIQAGCTHPLRITNLSSYKPTDMHPLSKRITIGMSVHEEDVNIKALLKDIGEELRKYAGDVVLPYHPESSTPVDLVADIRIVPEYKGAASNFFVNWPGFLIWAPAWNGYKYHVNYDISVMLTDAIKGKKIDQFQVPIKLNVKHAASNRTWTEISWLEVSVIAFIGGIVFTSYDPKVTPLVVESAGQTIGEYIGNEIITRINSSGF